MPEPVKITLPWSNVPDSIEEAQDTTRDLLGGFLPTVKVQHSVGEIDLMQLAKDNPLVTAASAALLGLIVYKAVR